MKRLFVSALVLGVLMLPLVAGAASVVVVQVTFDDNRDAETSIAINPKNAQNVVAGWISSGERTCAVGTSFDGGLTWSVDVLPGITTETGGRFEVGTDPSVTFDRSGNAYYTCLGFNNFPPGTGSSGALLVSKSTNGGRSWGRPVAAIDREILEGQHLGDFVDHQFITTNPNTGAIYLTETDFNAFGKPVILFTQSTDGNRTWSEPIQINDSGGNASFQDSFSAVGADPKTIYVTFGAFSSAGISNWNRIYIAKSTDGGATFSRPQLLQTITPLPDPLPNAPWRSDNNLWVAVDRATNQIYVNYADYNAGDADIRLMRARDLGNRFEVRGITRVNDDGPGSDQFFPFVTLAGGRVDICFQDRRYAPGNALIFTTCAFSTDGGLSFANVQVTTTGFDASNNNFIGDYNWQSSTTDGVTPIFVGDGFPGTDQTGQEVFVARVTP